MLDSTTPQDVRALARAAALVAALAQPDVAAVVAALPRRPGATASMSEIAEVTGLPMRTLGKALARGQDAGVLRGTGERVGLDPDGPHAAIAALVIRTPLGAALQDRPELLAKADYGLLHGIPSGEHGQELLVAVAALLPAGELSEVAATAALACLGDDPAGLRRALVDAGLLWRTRDGSRYQRRSDRVSDGGA